jgi:hypothetical protein
VSGGSALVLSSPAGTLLDVGHTDAATAADSGVAGEPGRQATWPGGVVRASPRPDIVNGNVVVMPGDVLVEAAHLVRSPVRLDVTGGRVTEIHGDSADADLLRSAIEALDPEDTARISVVAIGLACPRRPLSAPPGSIGPDPLAERPFRAGTCTLELTVDPAVDGATGPVVTIALGATSLTIDQAEVVLGGELVGAAAPDVYELAACD